MRIYKIQPFMDQEMFKFFSSSGDITTSIICEYSRRDIDAILDGNFKEADSTSFWRELPRDHVPEGVPRNVRFCLTINDQCLI